ncbi:MAG TPA: hypothetical protein VHJ83_14320 [Micromonosporaceae bacterium]|nr:hypothetical protein [Micromonosporaceae bacterium]
MDHHEPTDFPPDGYTDGDDGWFADPEEIRFPDPDPDLGYDLPSDDIDPEPDGLAAAEDDDHPPGDAYSDDLDGDPESVDDTAGGLSALNPDSQDPAQGTDPDLNPFADHESWAVDPFPSALNFDEPPEPVDGMPWADPDLLGGDLSGPLPDLAAGYEDAPPVADLYAYDLETPPHQDGDPWTSLTASEDPATSALARFWQPR